MIGERVMPKPQQIVRKEHLGLEVQWFGEDQPRVIPSENLRRACPCASCREERGEGSHDTPISPRQVENNLKGGKKPSSLQVVSHTKDEQLTLESIWAVGNYALGMRWGDAHDDGIYPFELLYELSHEQ
jgi:DUF971 family protein